MTALPDHVGVRAEGRLVYVLIADRAKFDAIAAPAQQHERVITKTIGEIGSGTTAVIFQHWVSVPASYSETEA